MSDLKNITLQSIKSLKFYIKIIFVLLILIYTLSGFYTVEQNEIAVVKRFGKIIYSSVKPGLSYSLPWPIDRVEKIKSKKMESMLIDNFAENPSKGSRGDLFTKITSLKTYLITGDNNIINFEILIKYTIDDPIKYTQNFKDIKSIINYIVSCQSILYFSSINIDDALIKARSQIHFKLKAIIQKKMNELNTGIRLAFVDIKKISPPSFILPYFNDVINANIDKKKMIEEAKTYKTKVISDLKILANKKINDAQIYANDIILNASAKINKFNLELQEYNKNKKLIQRKKYLEFLEYIYPYIKKDIFINNKLKGNIFLNHNN